MKEEAKLVGRSLMAGGAVGGEMVLPRLDMVFRLTARAVEPLIERLGATALQVGDDKASIGSLGAGLDPRDNALEETAGEFAPAVVSGYGDLAPMFDLIFHFRSGETAERVPRPWF